MKKIFTFLAVASVAMAANAGTRVLYSQDFETVKTAEEAGWKSPSNPSALKIESDDWGTFLNIAHGTTNGRTYYTEWGADIYGESASLIEDGIYTVVLEYSPTHSNPDANQSNAGLTVMSNRRGVDNQPFTGRWTYLKDADGNEITDMSLYQGYLFDLMQVSREDEATLGTSSLQFKINGNPDNLVNLEKEWYIINLTVNTLARTVEYEITTLSGSSITSGSREVPATDCDGTDISMYAEGLWVMGARSNSSYLLDNIKVTCESSADVANTPSCALTGLGKDEDDNVNLALRTYTINFIDGETLHILGPDGVETAVEFYECDGNYKYTTTTSGTLKCWTTCGTATSEVVEVVVDATPCALPEASLAIISVSEGYTKTYKITVDNKVVPLTPTIFIDAKFIGDDGEIVELNDEGTGTTITVHSSGTMTVTTKAFGYQSTSIRVVNDAPYTQKYVVDFARMTTDEIMAAGFTKDDDLNSATTSGEQNWTARKRMYYYDVNTAHPDEETGETVYDAVYPFGFVAEESENVLHRYIISDADMTDEKAATVFPNLTIWSGLQAKMLVNIGLIQDATKNNYNVVKVNNLEVGDVVVANTINDYGTNSCHPIVASTEEYFAVLGGADAAFAITGVDENPDTSLKSATCYVTKDSEDSPALTLNFKLYRIDTALTKVTVYKGEGSGISDVTVDKNIDNAWYTITGIRLDAPTGRGLYIHNGKKVLVK